jgi:hypothetical protein
LKIRKINKSAVPIIDNKICYLNKVVEIRNLNTLKWYINQGHEFKIYIDKKWINAKDYFENKKPEIDFKEIFSGHWTQQISKIEEYKDISIVRLLLKYAENNDVSDGIIKRIKNHLESLE